MTTNIENNGDRSSDDDLRSSRVYNYGSSSSEDQDEYFTGLENLPELKFIDTEVNSVTLPTLSWGSILPVNNNLHPVAQGDGGSDRDGRRYFITCVKLHIMVETSNLERLPAPADDILFSFAIILDRQTNQGAVTASNVYEGGTVPAFDFRNKFYETRYIVLYHEIDNLKRFQFSESTGTASHGKQRKVYHFKHKFVRPISVLCKGDTANVTAMTTNSLSLIAVASTTELKMSYTCRCLFRG